MAFAGQVIEVGRMSREEHRHAANATVMRW
jgi:hypothetical protein